MKKLLVATGGHISLREENGLKKDVPFPLCLAIRSDEEVMATCPNFVVDVTERKVFVWTNSPLPIGTPVLMHFYIPPEEKLLARIRGAVAPLDADSRYSQSGMLVKFGLFSRRETERLESYIQGKRHLVSVRA